MKADVEDIYALAPMQTGLLFQSLYAPHEGSYVEQSILNLDGPLDAEAFWRAWQLIVDRHPSLRTSFHWRSVRSPVQVVHRTMVLDRVEEDLRHLESAKQDAYVQDALDTERQRQFDLENVPLIRLTLYRLGDRSYRVAMRVSHLIVDGWSIGVMWTEFMAAYRAYVSEVDPQLPAAPAFGPYIQWWRGRDVTEAADYWARALDGYQPIGRMGEPSPPEANAPVLSHAALDTASLELADRVRTFSRRHHISQHAIVQAAWALVIALGTDSRDVAAGTVFAHRPPTLSGVEGMVGCMLATVPVRTEIAPDRRVLEWMFEVQDRIASARDHLGISVADIQERSAVPRNGVMFETMVEFGNVPLPTFDLGDSGVELVGYTTDGQPHMPLSLSAMPGDELPLRLTYDVGLFTPQTARAVLDATVRAAVAITEAGDQTVGDALGAISPLPRLATATEDPSPRSDRRTEFDSETERRVADLMMEILALDALGPDDDLLERGMHSLLGTRVINNLAKVFGVEVSLRALFDGPTVAEIARELEAVPAEASHSHGGTEAPEDARRRQVEELTSHIWVDADIAAATSAEAARGRSYFLTGATGTVGREILAALLRDTDAEVHCLVRGRAEQGWTRLREALASVPDGDSVDVRRVTIVPGTLAKPMFGLDQETFNALAGRIDTIVHAGASVNFLPPLRRLAPANIGGCREVLRLAATGPPSAVHHISSTAVFGEWIPGGGEYDEHPLSLDPPDLVNGYEQSKWVAEHVMASGRERGISVTTHRLGRLAGNSVSGTWKLGDIMSEVVRACVLSGMVPDTDSDLDFIPSDCAAAAVAAITQEPGATGGTYHIVNRNRFRLPILAEAMAAEDYPVRTVSVQEWVDELTAMASRDGDAKWAMVLPIVRPWAADIAAGLREGRYACDAASVHCASLAAGIPVDVDLIRTYLRHFAAVEFIPSPVQS